MIGASASDEEDRLLGRQRARRLYVDHVDAVFAYAARRVGADLAADVTSDMFRIALEQQARFEAQRGSELGWLYGIATNLLRRHWRTEARRLRAIARHAHGEEALIDPLLGVEDRITAADDATRLMNAVAALAPVDRDLLILATWQAASRQDIAESLGIPAGTVRSRLHRIRRELRTHMNSSYHDKEGRRAHE